jgi:hypothetical protein
MLYRAMLAKAKKDTSNAGFCQLLFCEFDLMTPGYTDGLASLPELYKHNQGRVDPNQSWFQSYDWGPRIKALKEAIKASAPAIAIGKASRNAGSEAKRRTVAKRTLVKRGSKRSPKKKK